MELRNSSIHVSLSQNSNSQNEHFEQKFNFDQNSTMNFKGNIFVLTCLESQSTKTPTIIKFKKIKVHKMP